MTYLQFLLVFVLPPLLALYRPWGAWRRVPRVRTAALALPFSALLYTTPWDNLLVALGIWSYGPDRVVGTIGWVPIEEYLFFLLQPLLVLGWLLTVRLDEAQAQPADHRTSQRAVVAALALVGIAGAVMIAYPTTRYLGLILAWAAPVLALLWAFTGDVVRQRTRRYAVAVLAPTVYLWLADGVAIRLGIWRIAEPTTTGLAVLGLPVEEMTFFLCTTLLCVHGALLFLEPWRLRWITTRS